MAELSAERGYVFPRGLEQWADFDYVGGRGPWITPAQWQTRRALQVLHAARLEAGRVAVAAARHVAVALQSRLVRPAG